MLGYSLKQVLYASDFDMISSLQRQKELIDQKMSRLDQVAHTIDGTIRQLKGEKSMKDSERFDGLDVDKILDEQEQYTDELVKRFDAEKVQESRERTKDYSKEKWGEVLEEGVAIARRVADLMNQGVASDDTGVQEEIERYHAYIDSNFYSCNIEIFKGLGEMYIVDERFTAHYEKLSEGLTVFFSEAIRLYCAKR